MLRKYSLVFATVLFSFISLSAQNHKADSLKIALVQAKSDTDRINILDRLGPALENTNPDSSILLAIKALSLAEQISWVKGEIVSEYELGTFYDIKGAPPLGIKYEDSALALCEKYHYNDKWGAVYNALGNLTSEENKDTLGLKYYFKALGFDSVYDKNFLPDLYNNIGLAYQDMGDYVKAEGYYFKALKIYEEKNNDDGIATLSSNLGNIYDLQGNYKKGIECHFKALKIDSASDRQDNVSLDYENIGNLYMSLGDYAKALEYSFKAIILSKKIGLVGNVSNALSNIGATFINIYKIDSLHKGFTYLKGNEKIFVAHSALLDSAMLYERKSIGAANVTSNALNLAYSYKGLGNIYAIRNIDDSAIYYFQLSYNVADSLGALLEKMEASLYLGRALVKKGRYDLATKYLNITINLKDTLFSREKEKAVGKIEAQFEDDKKMIVEKAIAAEKDKREKFVIAGVSVGLIVVLVFLVLLFKRFKITDKQRKIIEVQKKDMDAAYGKLNSAHAVLQEKDKDISDSIAYARKIQSAILPSEDYLKQTLGDYLLLYKPRNVVSGDFYWCHKEENRIVFAAVDCTGHGVPGAFMSMIGTSLLNQIVIENKVSDTAEILWQMRSNLLKQLQQKGQEAVSRDGMDMALCIWDKAKNTLQFSGANNSLYIVRTGITLNVLLDHRLVRPTGNDLLEVLPDKQPIGYQEGKMDIRFTSQSIQVQKGDCIYIATDGYHDQFGGARNKKFTSKGFRDILVSLKGKPMAEQKNTLDDTIEKWKSANEQTDDICVIGVKVS